MCVWSDAAEGRVLDRHLGIARDLAPENFEVKDAAVSGTVRVLHRQGSMSRDDVIEARLLGGVVPLPD